MKITFKEKQKTLFGRLKQLREKATPAELHIKKLLENLGIRFTFQKGFIAGYNYCIVDFYFSKPAYLCLEIDGKYHETDKQVLRDANRDNYLKNDRGFKVLRITNEQALALNSRTLFELLEPFIVLPKTVL